MENWAREIDFVVKQLKHLPKMLKVKVLAPNYMQAFQILGKCPSYWATGILVVGVSCSVFFYGIGLGAYLHG